MAGWRRADHAPARPRSAPHAAHGRVRACGHGRGSLALTDAPPRSVSPAQEHEVLVEVWKEAAAQLRALFAKIVGQIQNDDAACQVRRAASAAALR